MKGRSPQPLSRRRPACKRLSAAAALLVTGFMLQPARAALVNEEDPSVQVSEVISTNVSLPGVLFSSGLYMDFGHRSTASLFEKDRVVSTSEVIWRQLLKTPIIPFFPEPVKPPFRRLSMPEIIQERIVFPDNPEVLMVLGVRHYQVGDVEKSMELLAQALEMDPELVRAAELLSGIKAINEDPAEALPGLTALLDAHPDNHVIRFNAACAMAKTGDLRGCVRELNALAALNWEELIYHLNDEDLQPLYALPEFVEFQDLLLQVAWSRLGRQLIENPFKPRLVNDWLEDGE